MVRTHVGVDDDWRVGGGGVTVTEAGSAALDNGLAARGRAARQYRVLYALQASPALVVLSVLLHQRRKALQQTKPWVKTDKTMGEDG